MALINCKYCGHRISDKARACPKCGAAVLTQCSELDNTVQTSQIDQSTSHTQQETMKELSLEQNQFVESLQCSQPIEQQESTGDLPQEQEQFVELPKHAQPEEQEQPQTIQTDSESQDVEYESDGRKIMLVKLSGFHSRRKSALMLLERLKELLLLVENWFELPDVIKYSDEP